MRRESERRNLHSGVRWGAQDVQRIQKAAAELVGLARSHFGDGQSSRRDRCCTLRARCLLYSFRWMWHFHVPDNEAR
jgi:hypothetical protein